MHGTGCSVGLLGLVWACGATSLCSSASWRFFWPVARHRFARRPVGVVWACGPTSLCLSASGRFFGLWLDVALLVGQLPLFWLIGVLFDRPGATLSTLSGGESSGLAGGRIGSGLRPSGLCPVVAWRRRPNACGVCRTFRFEPCLSTWVLVDTGVIWSSIEPALYGWGGRIRTCECRDQNPVPCRLATPQSIGRVRSGRRERETG